MAYNTKQCRMRDAGPELSWEEIAKVCGSWTVFELLKPTKRVIEEVAPRYKEAFKKPLPKGAIFFTKALVKRNISKSAEHSPKVYLADIDNMVPVEYPNPEAAKQFADELPSYGFQNRSFTSNFLLFHPVIDKVDGISLTPMMMACYEAYKAVGEDTTISVDNLLTANKITEWACQSGDKWSHYVYMYCIAYLLRIIELRNADIDALKKRQGRLENSLSEERAKLPEVQVIREQVGEDRLRDALAEASSLRNEMEAYRRKVEHDVRAEYEALLAEKDNRIRELEGRLSANANYADEECEDVELPQAPEEGVCIVGGHATMHKQIAAQFPKWQMFASTSAVAQDGIKYGVVISKYVGHSVIKRFRKQCPGAQMVYTGSKSAYRVIQDLRLWLSCEN